MSSPFFLFIFVILTFFPFYSYACQQLSGIDYDSDSQKQVVSTSSVDCCGKISYYKAQAAVFDAAHNACWLKYGALKPKLCVAANCISICAEGQTCPSLPPTPSSYALNFDTTDDYLGIAANIDPSNPSSYYYLVIGDWGGVGNYLLLFVFFFCKIKTIKFLISHIDINYQVFY